jgi:hypothetical protein
MRLIWITLHQKSNKKSYERLRASYMLADNYYASAIK